MSNKCRRPCTPGHAVHAVHCRNRRARRATPGTPGSPKLPKSPGSPGSAKIAGIGRARRARRALPCTPCTAEIAGHAEIAGQGVQGHRRAVPHTVPPRHQHRLPGRARGRKNLERPGDPVIPARGVPPHPSHPRKRPESIEMGPCGPPLSTCLMALRLSPTRQSAFSATAAIRGLDTVSTGMPGRGPVYADPRSLARVVARSGTLGCTPAWVTRSPPALPCKRKATHEALKITPIAGVCKKPPAYACRSDRALSTVICPHRSSRRPIWLRAQLRSLQSSECTPGLTG